jgi:hypothetical protein
MLTLKSQVTCSYCSRIFKDPILLPCGDSICRQHLTERDVIKQNKIKCKACNTEFEVKNNQFKSNEGISKLLESQSYLNETEIKLKHELEASIRKFFEFYDEFVLNKSKLESDVFDHFQEIRFKIDQQREELKKRIDDIALAMIDETKKYQEKYLKELKESFSSYDDSQSLQIKSSEIEEKFRDPNLLIESIRDMQLKQEESSRDIQSKLNEMNQVKDNLIATNYFKPNLPSLNQEGDTSLFGSIRLDGYSKINPFKSEIVKGEQQCSELIKLCEFSPNDKWTLLYRATRNGFGSKDFHSKCDGYTNTLTIVKTKHSSYIFGGFTMAKWESSPKGKLKSDPNAFLFSLTNKDNQPVKMKIDPNRHHRAICCDPKYGPTFGGTDIRIANNANTTMDSFSNLGACYKHPQYEFETIEAQSFLAGSFNFQLDEIEVYQKE